MNVDEKKVLSREAQMQLQAIKRIGVWRKICMILSTLGLAAAYAGFAGTQNHLFLGIFGILVMLLSICAASVLNIGIKNGKRNVEKMLNVLEEGML